MKKKIGSEKIELIVVAILLVAAVACIPGYDDLSLMVCKTTGMPVVVIDPGHGGIDGGAVSRGGTNEKNINLAIALGVKEMLEKEGMKVLLTRGDDETCDVADRKRYVEKVKPDIAVSVHLNSFPQDSSVKGAQVFYPATGDEDAIKKGRLAAKLVQKEFNREINEKPRIELSKSDVYILRDAMYPTIIVECGFLSNPDDAGMLKRKDYQERICLITKNGICNYMLRMPKRG